MDKYTCDDCGRVFVSQFNLNRHYRKFHNSSDDDEDDQVENPSSPGESDQTEIIAEILEEIIDELKEDTPDIELDNVEDLLKPGTYSKVQEAFERKVRAIDYKMYQLKQTSIFREIQKTIETFSKTIPDINEAKSLAWNHRQFALKSYIESNQNDLSSLLFDNSNESGI